MTDLPQNIAEKPYNVCIECTHIGKNCDGPNFLAMSTERWCEWCHLRKEYLEWTNAHIADAAGVSDVSVARIMSGNVKDIRVTTMQAVTRALVNGSWGQYPCAMAAEDENEPDANPVIIEQCHRLEATIDAMKAEHKAELSELRTYDEGRLNYLKEQMKNKDTLLLERFALIKQRDRVILVLSILLGVSVLVIITALVMDILNPNMGFFWLDRLFGGITDAGGGIDKLSL